MRRARIALGATALLALISAMVMPAASATRFVPVTVRVIDTHGRPVAGFEFRLTSSAGSTTIGRVGTTGRDGTAVVSAYASSTARLYPQFSYRWGADYSHFRALDSVARVDETSPVGQPGSTLRFTAATGASGTTITVRVPPLETRTYRVVTPSGLPVIGVQISPYARVSVPVTDPATGAVYRWTDAVQYGPRTDAAGRATITGYALEKDATVVATVHPDWIHLTPPVFDDSLSAYYFTTEEASESIQVPYDQWAQTLTPTIRLAHEAPGVAVVTARPGRLVGDTVVTATLVRAGTGATNGRPLAGARAMLWAQVAPGAAITRLAVGTTDSRGVVHLTANTHSAIRMFVTLGDMFLSGVARFVHARPLSGVGFARVQFDSPGQDSRSASSLNGEYVQLRNYSTTARSVTGWTVRTRHGAVYRLPRLTLAPGATVTIHTGPGSARKGQLYWDRSDHVWSNTSDTATLRSAAGTVVDTCSWPRSGNGFVVC